MTKKRLIEFLFQINKKRKAVVAMAWTEMLDEYELLRKQKLLRRSKGDDGWYIYSITTRGEQLLQKLKAKTK